MPRLKFTGGRLDPGTVTDRMVPSNPTNKQASEPIQGRRYCRNGRNPDAHFLNALNEAANQAALYRSREAISVVGKFGVGVGGAIPVSTSGTRNRWRGWFHTGPLTHALYAQMVLVPPDSNYSNDTYGILALFSDVTESTPVSSTEFHYGPSPSVSTVAGWAYLKTITMYIAVDPDTDYYWIASDENYGRIVSLSALELPSMTENNAGYLGLNNSSSTPIVDVLRENPTTLIHSVWKRSGTRLIQWTVEEQSSPLTRASSTPINIVDNASTSITSVTPGYVLDMRYRDRLNQTSGIPCVMKAYGSMSAGTNGNVYLKNSSGSTIASIVAGWTTTPSWISVSFNLPAVSDKYDLQFSTAAGTFSLGAVGVQELET